jgi:hypothetical protein
MVGAFASGRERVNRSKLAETLYPRLHVLCQPPDAVPRLPPIRLTDPALAL